MSKALWHQMFTDLKKGIEAGVYSPEQPLPSENELAAKWGVSRLTAHRALYELQRAGLVMRRRKIGTVVLPPSAPEPVRIAALFFHSSDYFQGTLLGSVRAGLSENVHLSYVDTNRDAAAEANALIRMSEESDGIVLFPTCDPQNSSLIARLCREGKSIVCIDRHPPGVECDSVQTDNYAATYEALGNLANLGHRVVGCFCDFEEPVSSTGDRVRAYRDLLEVIGSDQREHFHAFPYLAPNSSEEYKQMIEMVQESLGESMNSSNPPTAIFCTREHYASAVVDACSNFGISVPSDLTVIAFVDRPAYLLGLPESVLRIRQDLATMGKVAAERAMARARGDSLPIECILVPALQSDLLSGSELNLLEPARS
jgi:GntR family transcriptional regulator of arabinose operon